MARGDVTPPFAPFGGDFRGVVGTYQHKIDKKKWKWKIQLTRNTDDKKTLQLLQVLALFAFTERLGLCVSRGKTMTGFDTYRA